MYGGVVHPVDILRSFLGDVEEVHAYGAKGKLTPEYPIKNNFFLNLKFAGGQIARAMGLYDIVHPPMPMMQVLNLRHRRHHDRRFHRQQRWTGQANLG